MQAYNASFARIYNMRWARFAQTIAPQLRAVYEDTPVGRQNHTLLDLCCGSGQLAQHFLDAGYEVTGLDLSEPMLEYARSNTAPYLVTGQIRFVHADASNFILEDRYGLVVSTFDALNHLPDFDALKGCFRSAFPVLVDGGMFIFDLNTLEGLRRWTNFSLEDTAELMLVMRAVFDETSQKAYSYISGFVQNANGLYERFEETTAETAFSLDAVRQSLLETGFRSVRMARSADLTVPVENPEREHRIFIIAEK